MSPVSGVGFNYAIQDAVVAANILAGPLKAGRLTESDLAKVQRQRLWPTSVVVVQTLQSVFQKNLIGNIRASQQPARVPWQLRALVHVPILRDLPGKLIAFGPRRVRLREA